MATAKNQKLCLLNSMEKMIVHRNFNSEWASKKKKKKLCGHIDGTQLKPHDQMRLDSKFAEWNQM